MTEEVRPLRRYLTAVAIVATMLTAAPAHAMQLGVDSQDQHHMRQGLIRWNHKVEGLRLQAAREAAAAAEAAAAEQEQTAEPAPIPSYSGVLSAEQVASFARGAGFPEGIVPTMVAIAWRESRFNPGAVNSSSGACGLWQMYPCPGPHALDPATNAAMAYAKYAASGFSPWGG